MNDCHGIVCACRAAMSHMAAQKQRYWQPRIVLPDEADGIANAMQWVLPRRRGVFTSCRAKAGFKSVLYAAVELSRALLHLRVPEWAVEEATNADDNPEYQRNRWGWPPPCRSHLLWGNLAHVWQPRRPSATLRSMAATMLRCCQNSL